MTPKQLEEIGYELFGHHWQTALAHALGVKPRTVRRWKAGDTPIGQRTEVAILALHDSVRRTAETEEALRSIPEQFTGGRS